MRNGIIVCRLSLIKTYLLAFHILRKFRDSAPLRSCEEEAQKNSGLNGNRNHDLCDAGAVLYQLSYQANCELVIL